MSFSASAKVAERNLSIVQEELATLARERRQVETEIERSIEKRRLEDAELSQMTGGVIDIPGSTGFRVAKVSQLGD